MANQDQPYQSPESHTNAEEQQKTSVGRVMYVHSIAILGSLVAFVGGFGGAFVIPTMLSQDLAASRRGVTILLVVAVAVGLLCAVLSYRATLRTHAKR